MFCVCCVCMGMSFLSLGIFSSLILLRLVYAIDLGVFLYAYNA